MNEEDGGEDNEQQQAARIKASDEPKNIEKDILRYYYYIHNGIDTEHVAPLENVRIQNVMSKITEKLKRNYKQYVIDLCDEVREDYLLSVKKAIVDFVLRDSREIVTSEAKKEKKLPEHRLELELVPKPWHASFEKARAEIYKNLYSINPCMSRLLTLWHVSYRLVGCC
jgi:dynein heavy chain